VQVGTFRNDSSLADSIGIPTLKEEKSTNFSLGGVLNPHESLNITIDYYAIDIDDRIVISNKLVEGLSPALDAILQGAGAGAGQFFLNGADTQTRGLDVIASWQTLALAGDLTLTLAANITDTKVTDLFTPPGSRLNDIAPEEIFSRQDISIIEQWQPQDRLHLGALFKKDNLNINLSFNRFGEYTILDLQKQTYSAELLTDIRVQYQWSKAVSIYMGGNNIFDVYPDKNNIGNSRGGTILDSQGNEVVSSPGVFTYSRRSAPFGFNGGYYYAGINYRF
jgi:iron complex outermembrane receptor protein